MIAPILTLTKVIARPHANQNNQANVTDLRKLKNWPKEIILMVFSHLSISDRLMKGRMLCKRWYYLDETKTLCLESALTGRLKILNNIAVNFFYPSKSN